MNNKPQSVKDYLETLDGKPRADGYLCFDKNNELVCSAGWLGSINLTDLDHAQNPFLLIPELEGLLPSQDPESTVIHNVAVDNNHYLDIHQFKDFSGYWLIFIDNTQTGKRLQKEQQIRLDDDFANDKRGTGS